MTRFPLIPMTPPPRRLMALASFLLLGACASAFDRMNTIGEPLPLAQIENPLQAPTYQAVITPLPAPVLVARQANSLWRPGAKAFFRDQRASRVGDILTVNVAISDQANVSNTTNRSREAAEDTDVTNLFGLEAEFGKVLPNALFARLGGQPWQQKLDQGRRRRGAVRDHQSYRRRPGPSGAVKRQHGDPGPPGSPRQLRNSRIDRDRNCSPGGHYFRQHYAHTQIAEARISYGGRGQITDVQQTRYGQQILDIIAPF